MTSTNIFETEYTNRLNRALRGVTTDHLDPNGDVADIVDDLVDLAFEVLNAEGFDLRHEGTVLHVLNWAEDKGLDVIGLDQDED